MDASKQIAEPNEPVACGDVPLAPFELTHRTESELAAAVAGEPRAVAHPGLLATILNRLRSAAPQLRAPGGLGALAPRGARR